MSTVGPSTRGWKKFPSVTEKTLFRSAILRVLNCYFLVFLLYREWTSGFSSISKKIWSGIVTQVVRRCTRGCRFKLWKVYFRQDMKNDSEKGRKKCIRIFQVISCKDKFFYRSFNAITAFWSSYEIVSTQIKVLSYSFMVLSNISVILLLWGEYHLVLQLVPYHDSKCGCQVFNTL